MKKLFLVFVGGVLVCGSVWGDSFLSAQSFPGTFEDLSFTARMQFLQDDYEIYAPEYDDNGVCVKNCAYTGLNIVDEERIDRENTVASVEKSKQYEQQKPVVAVVQPGCSNRNTSIPSGQSVPWSEPLADEPYITSKFGPRILNGKQGYHDGIDYRAPVGTTVYAPADGVVTGVFAQKSCGNGVSVKHPDGTTTSYCHLSKALVQKGENVYAGCPIAETGNTGHSTGPHLHYAVRDTNGKKVNPAKYTNRGEN